MSETSCTIKYAGHDFTVRGNFIPGEPPVFHPVDEAYPGSPDVFEIEELFIGEHPDCVLELMAESVVDDIVELCIAAIKRGE